MHIISILFFAISSSSDNFVIGLSYGTKKVDINFKMNLVVAGISCIGTVFAMLAGKYISNFLLPDHTNMIGSILLLLLGVIMLLNSFKKKESGESKDKKIFCYNEMIDHPELLDLNHSKTIEFKEAVLLGGILCINNIGLGIAVSFSGLNIYVTSISSLLFSVLFVKLGCTIGSFVSSGKLSVYAEKISAVIIILLGIYELFI